jgi:tetratricopeptide (TPR) repeat protein
MSMSFDEAVSEAKSAQYALIASYIKNEQFGNPVPRLEGKALEKYISSSFTAPQISQIKDAVAREYDRGIREEVYPAWITWKKGGIERKAMSLVDEAKTSAETNGFTRAHAAFEQAREIAWRESVDVKLNGKFVEEVYKPVWAASIELLDTRINIAEWLVSEKELHYIATSACDSGALEEGIAALKTYKPVRAYTKILDDHVASITAELISLKVPKQAIDSIIDKTRAFMLRAANLADNVDKTSEKTIPGKAASSIDESRYRELVEEYRKALKTYDCTDANASKITSWLLECIAKLVSELPREEATPDTVVTNIDRLGATALNKRIDDLRNSLVLELDEGLARRRKMESEMASLSKKEDLESARAKVAKILSKNSDSPAYLKSAARSMLLTKINPELWRVIEKEILKKTDSCLSAGDMTGGVAWLAAYPYIRTYDAEIDTRFAAVKKEAIAVGVPDSIASSIMLDVATTTAEVEYLACYEDGYRDNFQPGLQLSDEALRKYEKAIADCRETLVRNGCTDANADMLVAKIRNGFDKEFNRLRADVNNPIFSLGSNALNARLRALKKKCAIRLVAGVASNLVLADKFDAARAAIRDVALSGDADFDQAVSAARVGVLDTIVNPMQLEARKAEANETIVKFWKLRDYRGLEKWRDEYPYVHDDYPALADAYAAISSAVGALGVEADDAKDYIDGLAVNVRTLIEKLGGTYEPEKKGFDFSQLQKALDSFEKAFIAQYYDTAVAAMVRESILKKIKEMLVDEPIDPITTWDLNEKIKDYIAKRILVLMKIKAGADADLAQIEERLRYLQHLADINKDISYDSQIAMAEDAIAKQLRICPASRGNLSANAALGEYARSMRMLKHDGKLDADGLASMVFGAVYLDQPAVLERALELGASVDAPCSRDTLARTPLLLAIQLGRVKLVRDLVAAGANVACVDAAKDTAVHYAVRRGNIAMLKVMLEKNDVNGVNAAGETPLFDAARANQPPIVDALIEAKAKVDIVNGAKKTPFDEACRCGSRDVLDSLAEAGAKYGPAQLAIAATNDHLAVAQWLVGHAVDVNGKGVMASTLTNSVTKAYLVGEGGLAPAECKPEPPAPPPAPLTEARGKIEFTVRDVSVEDKTTKEKEDEPEEKK